MVRMILDKRGNEGTGWLEGLRMQGQQ